MSRVTAKYQLLPTLDCELKVQEAPIEISRSGDIVQATLGGGQLASMKLQREPGADGKGVVLQNVKYFGAQNNRLFASPRLGGEYDDCHIVVLLCSGNERVSGSHDATNDLSRRQA